MQRVIRMIAAAMVCMVAAGRCGYGDWPTKYDAFFNVPLNERRTAVLAYPPGDQLELHVHATCDLHPAYVHLAEVIAEQRGAALVEPLRHALEAQAADPETRDCRVHALGLVADELSRRSVVVDEATRKMLVQSR